MEASVVTFHTWFTFAVIILAVISYSIEKISLELTSLLTIAILMVFYHFFPLVSPSGDTLLSPEHIILGFSNTSLLAIVALLIIGQAIVQSNILSVIASFIQKISFNNFHFSFLICLVIVIIISAFLNNTPVVVIFIPILAQIANNFNVPNSKVMIPLSYIAILGGMVTLIGSSTNLLVSTSVENMGLDPIGFFEFSKPGMILSGVGLLYIFFLLPRILPDTSSDEDSIIDDRNFVCEMTINSNSKLSNHKILHGHLEKFSEIKLLLIKRGEKTLFAPFQDDFQLENGDIIVLSSSKKNFSNFINKNLDYFFSNQELNNTDKSAKNFENMSIAELVVAPASSLIGKTIDSIYLLNENHSRIVALQRKGNVVRNILSRLRLVSGDVLLVLGEAEDINKLKYSSDFILTKWTFENIPSIARVIKTISVFLLVVLFSSFNILPIHVSAFLGASLMILLKCITMKQVTRSIDVKVCLLIVASLAMGIAFQQSGGASYLADILLQFLAPFSMIYILAFLFFIIVIVTNLLSNATTAVLFTPLAVNLALNLNVDPKIFIYAVIFACNCSFLTPIGYQTNLLVMGPGRYKFKNYIKAGLPLVILICITYCFLIKYYFNIS
jgi:di/tricarboxylate transporter